MDMVKNLHIEPPAITYLGDASTSTEVNLSQKKNRRRKRKKHGKVAEPEDKGADFSLDNSSMKTDASMNKTLHESPAKPNLLSSQITAELISTKKKRRRKRLKSRHNAIESNVDGCGVPKHTFSTEISTPALDMPSEHPIQYKSTDPKTRQSCVGKDSKDTFSTETSTPPLDMPSEHPIHYVSTDPETRQSCERRDLKDTFSPETSALALDMPSGHPIQCVSTNPETKQSCVRRGFHLEENEGNNEHNMLKMEAKSSNGEHDLREVSSTYNSVVANAEGFVKKLSVLEVVKLNLEPGINDSSSNPEDKNGFVKNVILMKKHDDCPEVCHISQKFPNLKTYTRRKSVNSNYGRNSDYPGSENYNKEPTMVNHCKYDLHKFSDGSFAVGLMEKETKLPADEIISNRGAAAEEMKFITDYTSEQRIVTPSSVVDIPTVQLEETNGSQQGHFEITRNDLCSAGDVAELSLDDHSKISHFSLDTTITSISKKKLLVLDVNGLLADFVGHVPRGFKQPDLRMKRRAVYKRPFCDDFLQFCFDRFHVGVWSSRAKTNVDTAIEFLMAKSASKLLFCWNQSHCTTTKFCTVENTTKPLVLKELRKLWEKLEPGLPWEKGVFNETNTLLLDDSPYKALVNPMYTAVFPYSYQFTDTRDTSLGPGGDLRVYLEGLAVAENVQEYVASNPFGQRAITESNPSWVYYSKVIDAVKRRQNAKTSSSGSK